MGNNTGKGQGIRCDWDYKNQVRLVYVTLSGHKCVVNTYICKIMLWDIRRKLKALSLVCLLEQRQDQSENESVRGNEREVQRRWGKEFSRPMLEQLDWSMWEFGSGSLFSGVLTGKDAVFEETVGEVLFLRHHGVCVTRFAVLLNCLVKHFQVLFSETIAANR